MEPTDLQKLQSKRAKFEEKANEAWLAFCRAALDAVGTDYDKYDELIDKALEYGSNIRRAEWENDKITRHLMR